ncbi:MAG TPA: hypothetical protein VN924_13335 [Bryobacteraceae bacterium]|jgi:hypothetical protein|nr:hypothetical protein [Bryobacteraceae bacterium]
MRYVTRVTVGLAFAALLSAQTAEELVNKNLTAHGGVEKLKEIRSLRMTGKLQQGSFTAQLGLDTMAPDLVKQSFTIMSMTGISAYDGAIGWRIMPFGGRKDPEMLGEDDLRALQDESDFYGHLVDYKAKGNTIEYLGHDTVDGDDAYRLKVTLKNGDIVYYYLDPETFLEVRTELVQFIHGSVKESFSEMGSYKLVNGIYFPFALEQGNPRNPGETSKITIDKIEANVAIDPAEFKMPAAAPAASPSAPPKKESSL